MIAQFLYNGKIFTSDSENPYADAMLVAGGKIRWIGNLLGHKNTEKAEGAEKLDEIEKIEMTNEIEEIANIEKLGKIKKIDLLGRRVIPGFVDSHMHGIMTALAAKQISCLPPEFHSIKELQDMIGQRRIMLLDRYAVSKYEKIAEPEHGESNSARTDRIQADSLQEPCKNRPWIEAWGYDEGKLAEHRSPTRYDLDEASPDFPVIVMRTCAHSACVNSLALQIAGICADTPNPEGGEIDREANGEPSGILRDSAINLVTRYLPRNTREQTVQNLISLSKQLSSYGITTVTDLGVFEKTDYYDDYITASRNGFEQKAALYYIWDYHHNDLDFHIPRERFHTDHQIFVAGIKLISDGSISGRTAWLNAPYLGGRDSGISVCTDQVLSSAVEACKRYGCRLTVHAMGGRAIDRISAQLADEQKWNLSAAPHLRLEHITEPSEDAVLCAAEKGIPFVTQPIFLYSEIESYVRNLGTGRLKKTYPIRTMLEKGVRIALSSDSPANGWAVPFDPFIGLQAAVTRIAYDGTDLGQSKKITVEEAIRLYTAEGAYVLGVQDRGILKPGYAADFAVLDRDILRIPPEDISRVKVYQTFIGGVQVYEKPKY